MENSSNLGRQVVYCGHLARQCLENRVRQFGVTPVQAYAMRFLAINQDRREIAQRDLERELRLKASTVNGVVDRLVEKGMLLRQTSPTDGRCRLLSLTPLGIQVAETFQSALRGLYPCGEGAGYAGGIVSAAVDGIRVAEAVARG